MNGKIMQSKKKAEHCTSIKRAPNNKQRKKNKVSVGVLSTHSIQNTCVWVVKKWRNS